MVVAGEDGDDKCPTDALVMDRETWMYKTLRSSEIYAKGVRSFKKAAEENRLKTGRRSICCPCSVCYTFKYFNGTDEIEFHLLRHGFMHGYYCWYEHGESILEFSTLSTTLHINDSTYNNDSLDLDNDDDHSNEPVENYNIEMLHDMETNIYG
ncbi:hypothetical protein QVD17_40355 [Tagetes erecta]|uniref:Transposase-associated domain-containing protein n=1 Tax=Tagetes erecta TaxID=13708 RepID=A0AAD8NG33_TARER|nr:hypothetical protein QVD17_40355 [Tagetes erecta]